MFRGTRNKSSSARRGRFRRTIHLLTEPVLDLDLCAPVAHKPTIFLGSMLEIHPASKAGGRVGSSFIAHRRRPFVLFGYLSYQTMSAQGPTLLFQHQVPPVSSSDPFNSLVKSTMFFLFRQPGESFRQGVAV